MTTSYGVRNLAKHTVGLTVVLALSAGCSNVQEEPESSLNYTPRVKPISDARTEARELSSRLLDWTEIQGRTTEPGPVVQACPAAPDDATLYRMWHPWTIYEVPAETLERGRANLRERLMQEGWELLVDEEMDNQDRTPRLLFESNEVEYAVDIQLTGRNRDDPQLEIWTQSACFRTPDGETRNGS